MNVLSSATAWRPLALSFLALAVWGEPAIADTLPGPLENIVVTSRAGGIRVGREEVAVTPGGVSLLDVDALRERSVGHLGDALRFAPGVWAASDSGHDALFLSSRGSNLDATSWDLNGVKLLQDGLPVTSADGNNHNRVVDPLAARYAIIARGANAYRYGASTLGGAANFVSPTANDVAPFEAMFSSGSHGQTAARVTAAGRLGERSDGVLTVENKRWDGYREHGSHRRSGLYGNVGVRVGERIETRFFVTSVENERELPGHLTRDEFERDPSRANAAALAGHYQSNVDTWRIANKTTMRLDGERVLEWGLSHERQSLYHPIVWVAAGDVELFSLLIDSDHRDTGAMLRYRDAIGRHELEFGANVARGSVEGAHYRNLRGHPNGLRETVANEARTLEVFVVDRWRLAAGTTLLMGLQAVDAERMASTTAVATGAIRAPAGRFDAINPRLGVLHAISPRTTLYANASRLFEPPTNFELEDNAAGGDAVLEAMHGTVLEVGARGGRALGADSRWGWDVALYHARIRDEILSTEDPDAPGTSLVTNIDRTVHEGIEALVEAAIPLLGGTLEPRISATLNRFHFDGDPVYGDARLPAAPRHFVRGELIYRTQAGFYFGPTFDLIGRRYADFVNEYEIDSYRLLGARGGWSDERWTVYAEVRNATDERFVSTHAVRLRAMPGDAMLNPGEPRSLYVGVQVRFD